MRHQILLEGHHDGGCLFGLCAAATAQVDIGLWDVEFLKKRLAHLAVVVLTCVNETIMNVFALLLRLLNGVYQGSDLHKVGARARNKRNMSHIYLNLY